MKAVSNTSPLLYLYRVGGLCWLEVIFEEVWVPEAVLDELSEGRQRGYEVPDPSSYSWIRVANPRNMPSEWLATDLGSGELGAMALGLEHPESIVLLDDLLARRIARAAGLTVWGTLRIILEAKERGLIQEIKPCVKELRKAGMWLSQEIERRILRLAGEAF